jgi:hypothetical protein
MDTVADLLVGVLITGMTLLAMMAVMARDKRRPGRLTPSQYAKLMEQQQARIAEQVQPRRPVVATPDEARIIERAKAYGAEVVE